MTTVARVQVWDLPLRIFHWLLAIAVIAAVVTAKVGADWMLWHGRLGLVVVGLLGFRLVWGFVGTTHARFANFFPTPSKISLYLRGQWQGLGHNPLGALSVLALLGLLAMQVGSGLFANDDIVFNGPLQALVSKETSDTLSRWHHKMATVLYVLVFMHVSAIVFYLRVKRQNLIQPMVTGWQTELPVPQPPAQSGSRVSLSIALGTACVLIYVASGAWLSAPTEQPALQNLIEVRLSLPAESGLF